MPAPIVILDANNEMYRAFYSTGAMSYDGDATGVVYGFMRTVKSIEARWPLCRLVFAFDYGKSIREKEFPWYKSTRKAKRKLEMKDRGKRKMFRGMDEQVEKLREEYLTRVGYQNVFKAKGYEADDIIGRVVKDIRLQEREPAFKTKTRIIIVSGDQDFYQLIRKNTDVWHPRNRFLCDLPWFEKEWCIRPEQWVKVKAIAGCKSDDIPGVKGVGEKTAASYLTGIPGRVRPDLLDDIYDWETTREYARNLRLIKLPLEGCPSFKVKTDKPDPAAWDELMSEIGAKSLLKAQNSMGEAIF
jgi:DNA polymerase-1